MRLTYSDREGTTRLQAWALPLAVAALALPITAAFLLGGAAAGLAMGALTAGTIVVIAARSKPFRVMEVASGDELGRRLLVVAAADVDPAAAERIATIAAGPADVRILVPAPSTRLSRWLSAEDRARRQGRDRLARAAGTLTAAGLNVSGSVGDSDQVQAVEDELRTFAADEVVLIPENGSEAQTERLRGRLGLPLTTVRSR